MITTLRKSLFVLSLCFSSQAISQQICMQIEDQEDCFSDLEDAMEQFELLEGAVKGKVGTDRPNMKDLMKAAVDALGSRGFEGEITVEVTTPSGYIFKVVVKGGSNGRRPKPIVKPNR